MDPKSKKKSMFEKWTQQQIWTHLHKRRRKHKRAVMPVVAVAVAAMVVAVVAVVAVVTAARGGKGSRGAAAVRACIHIRPLYIMPNI